MLVDYISLPKLKKAFAIAIAFFALTSCKKETQEIPVENYSVKDNIITLSENSTIKAQLQIAVAQKEKVSLDLDVNGYVKAIPSQYAKIASPFVGRITQSFVKLGQQVKKGTPIFAISSSDYFSAQQTYLTNFQELKIAEINLKRQQDLFKNAVGVKRELEAAELDFKIKKLAVDQATATLQVYNVNPAKMKIGEALIVTSPIAGTVIFNDLIIGQFLKEDSEPLVTIAELSNVWIAAQVKEKDLAILKNLSEVTLFAEAYSNSPFSGKIINIGEVVNEETRSVEILVEVDNQKKQLKPGMYVSVRLKDDGKEALVIPTKAIFQENDHSFVFIQVANNQFKKNKITALSTNDPSTTAVLEGLNETDKIITAGGIYLLQAK